MRFGRGLAGCALLGLMGAGVPSADDGPIGPPPMQGERMAMLGIGSSNTCRSFLAAFETEMQRRPPGAQDVNTYYTPVFGALMSWSDGYVTAKNEVDLIQRDAGLTTTFMQRARWIQLFCQANPDATFFAAVYRLREHLVADGL